MTGARKRHNNDVVIVNAEVEQKIVSVRLSGEHIVEIGPTISPKPNDEFLDAKGGALLPGLHDHHIHLLALAAAMSSINVGPPVVANMDQLRRTLRAAANAVTKESAQSNAGWIRAIGYHESVAGPIDRYVLDAIVHDVPVRMQYRTGTLWMLNSLAISELELSTRDHSAIERDGRGDPTGRIFGGDTIIRRVNDEVDVPAMLQKVSARLNSFGVTSVTDATPFEDMSSIDLLARSQMTQHLCVMGSPRLVPALANHGRQHLGSIEVGPVKLVVGDHALPSIEQLIAWMRVARTQQRCVAMHCVTRVGLVLALAAWEEVGVIDGDRIEHGGVIDVYEIERIVALGLIVVTQPSFIRDRGDQYLVDVEPHDREHLYRCASLISAGVRVAGSTDAPFGNPDPWVAISAAIDRVTAAGASLGRGERLSPQHAVNLFLSNASSPGGPSRCIEVGEPADVVVLGMPLDEMLSKPTSENVHATLRDGTIVFQRL